MFKHGSFSGKSVVLDPATDPEDMGRLDFGIKLHIVAAPVPNVARLTKKIVDLISVPFHRAKLFHWKFDERMLFSMGIEVHDDNDDVVPRGGHFRVTEDRVIVRVEKSQIVVGPKRPVGSANMV